MSACELCAISAPHGYRSPALGSSSPCLDPRSFRCRRSRCSCATASPLRPCRPSRSPTRWALPAHRLLSPRPPVCPWQPWRAGQARGDIDSRSNTRISQMWRRRARIRKSCPPKCVCPEWRNVPSLHRMGIYVCHRCVRCVRCVRYVAEFRIQNSDFRLHGWREPGQAASEFRIQNSEFRIQSPWLERARAGSLRIQNSEFRIQTSDFRIQTSESTVGESWEVGETSVFAVNRGSECRTQNSEFMLSEFR